MVTFDLLLAGSKILAKVARLYDYARCVNIKYRIGAIAPVPRVDSVMPSSARGEPL